VDLSRSTSQIEGNVYQCFFVVVVVVCFLFFWGGVFFNYKGSFVSVNAKEMPMMNQRWEEILTVSFEYH